MVAKSFQVEVQRPFFRPLPFTDSLPSTLDAFYATARAVRHDL